MARLKSTVPLSTLPSDTARGWLKVAAFAGLIVAVAVIWYLFRDEASLERLTAREAILRQDYRDHSFVVAGTAFIAYVIVAALSIPLATVLSLMYGWLFGFWQGTILVSFASTAGATLAFLISRHLLGDIVAQRFARWVPRITEALERDGALYLFAMRLTPAVPFVVINVVMGLTPLRVRTFWWVSQLGMLPATCLIVYAGSALPDLRTLAEGGPREIISLPIAIALVLLGLFPLAARWILTRLQRKRADIP